MRATTAGAPAASTPLLIYPGLKLHQAFDHRPLKVMKFGGTSVGSAEALRQVARIVAAATPTHRIVVVASALSGVTNKLVDALDALEAGTFSRAALLHFLRNRHLDLAAQLIPLPRLHSYETHLHPLLAALDSVLARLEKQGVSPAGRDAVLAFGERLSAPLVAAFLSEHGARATAHAADDLFLTDDTFGEAVLDTEMTRRLICAWFARQPSDAVAVVTGFIARTADGRTTTLGRGGSDYTAAVLARALRATVLERWTDVDGIYTADPRTHPEAEHLQLLSLEEAYRRHETHGLGMHPKVLAPLVEGRIALHVRSTLKPTRGTLVMPYQKADTLHDLVR